MDRRRTSWALAALVLFVTSHAEAHGGAEVATNFLDPATHDVVVDDRVTITWTDFDTNGDSGPAYQFFFFTKDQPPPWPIWAQPTFLEGEAIVGDIPLVDPTNAITWNTSTVAAGAYWVWSMVEDADIVNPASTIRFTPFPVSVAHPGDPVHPSIVITGPTNAFEIADREYVIEWSAFDPDGTGRVTLSAGTSTDGADLDVLATDLSAADGRYTWDTSALPEGDYLIRAELEDARGFDFTAFAPNLLLVAHAPVIARDAGVPTDAGTRDAGPTLTATPTPETPEGCQCTGRPRDRPVSLLGLAALVLLALSRRTPTPRTGDPRRANARSGPPRMPIRLDPSGSVLVASKSGRTEDR